MSIYITAQLVGLIGYLFYISAPKFKTRQNIIKCEIIACIILCQQWLLLGQYGLFALNFLCVFLGLFTILRKANPDLKAFIPLVYISGCLVILSFATGTLTDGLAIGAYILHVRSKCSDDILDFRIYASLAGMVLIISGGWALSIPAMIFNTLFTARHLINVISLAKERRAPVFA